MTDIQFIIDNFEYIFDSAEKIKNFDSIILQLAVSGKLNTHDPNDGPASELLKKIKAEKEKLIKQGKIKKEKPLSPIKESEIPYRLTQGWEWCRLGEIGNAINYPIVDGPFGSSVNTNTDYISEGVPVIRMMNVKPLCFLDNDLKFISYEKFETLRRHNILPNDVLFSKVGAGIGDCCIYPENYPEAMLSTTGVTRFRGGQVVTPKYLCYFLISYRNNFVAMASQTAQPFLNMGMIKNVVFPLPPLEEQKRIVEVIEKLLAKSAEIKEYLSRKNKKLIKINQSALHHLQESKTDEDFKKNFELIINNFNDLYVNQENLKALRQSILQLAVQGKLVPQNPNDEPASELLKKIKTEKDKLIKEGKIKKEKPLPSVKESEVPYKLPQGWEWVRLGEIVEILNGYAFKSSNYVENAINQVIRLGNVKNTGLLLSANPVFIPDKIAQDAYAYEIFKNDILVTLTGTRLKRDYFYTGLVKEENLINRKLYLNQRVGCIRCNKEVYIPLINTFLKTFVILDAIFKTETGTANQGNIGTTATKELLFPLPPLAEQKRIVAKVDELMKLCDELEDKIKQKNKSSDILMRSVLHWVGKAERELAVV